MQVIIGRVLPYTRLLLIISKELVWYADVLAAASHGLFVPGADSTLVTGLTNVIVHGEFAA